MLFYFHRRERRVYYLHRYKARKHPSKYLTIIDDAMDQKTTCTPRVRRKTKATCNLATVGTHLLGEIFHSGQSPNGKDVLGSFEYYPVATWPKLDSICFAGHVSSMVWKVWTSTSVVPPIGQLCQREQEPIYFVASCSSCGIKDFWEGKILVSYWQFLS